MKDGMNKLTSEWIDKPMHQTIYEPAIETTN